jgi:hypothetical protein
VRGGAACLAVSVVIGCSRVAEVPGTELPRLDRHGPGRPPVSVHTTSGQVVEVDGEFDSARVVIGGDGLEQTYAVYPPFRATLADGVLTYGHNQVDGADVLRVEVVQKDGWRTFQVLMIGGAALLAGGALGIYLDGRSSPEQGGGTCRCTWTYVTALAMGGVAFAIVIPATKYY